MNKVKLAVKKALSHLPSKLPVGLTEFHKFADSVLELTGKFADEDSMKFAIASMIIHAPAGKDSLPKNHFVQGLRKSAANQVASQVFQDIKTKQQEAALAAQAADTAKQLEKAASDGNQQKESNQ
jgi:hypothetical protein